MAASFDSAMVGILFHFVSYKKRDDHILVAMNFKGHTLDTFPTDGLAFQGLTGVN
jgi:hypothetical protein